MDMIKHEAAEQAKDFQCIYNHNLPPYMVIFDPKLSQNERILCLKCMEDFDRITKMVTFKKAQQMVEEKQIKKNEILENVIQPNIRQVELLQKNLHQLKSFVNQEFDQLIENTCEWIKNFDQIRKFHKNYNLVQELDKLIKNERNENIDESLFIQEITKINLSLSIKINSKLEQFKNFNDYTKCSQILQNIINTEMSECSTDLEKSTIETQMTDSIESISNSNIDSIEKNLAYYRELEQIQYYIYEDLQNLVNLLYSFKAVNEHFKNNLKHPMITVSRNKIILQLNLSNGIYLDLQQQYQKNPFKYVLLEEKKNALKIINQFAQALGIDYQSYIDYFKSNSLSEIISFKQQNLEKVTFSGSSNSQQTTNIFLQTQKNEKIFSHWINSKTYNSKSFDSFIFKAISYKQLTEIKLLSNFPISNQNSSDK
ncbi:unnamed protein product [Paramecium sonneborni]|uniref:Uncharacterized protein n=1 Tax=Paramecium sonneborni TaxID=65129 RepID=A0A8S1NXI2_9CILI|nr:unnamed protein product [Paramecium sonneborni]